MENVGSGVMELLTTDSENTIPTSDTIVPASHFQPFRMVALLVERGVINERILTHCFALLVRGTECGLIAGLRLPTGAAHAETRKERKSRVI